MGPRTRYKFFTQEPKLSLTNDIQILIYYHYFANYTNYEYWSLLFSLSTSFVTSTYNWKPNEMVLTVFYGA